MSGLIQGAITSPEPPHPLSFHLHVTLFHLLTTQPPLPFMPSHLISLSHPYTQPISPSSYPLPHPSPSLHSSPIFPLLSPPHTYSPRPYSSTPVSSSSSLLSHLHPCLLLPHFLSFLHTPFIPGIPIMITRKPDSRDQADLILGPLYPLPVLFCVLDIDALQASVSSSI